LTRLRDLIAGCLGVLTLCVGLAMPAAALKSIDIGTDVERVDITTLGESVEARGDTLQIETAQAADGTTGRMSVRAATPGTNPNWFVFALKNPTDKPIERWVLADRYSHAGSGIVWPNLDARRIEGVTPSLGFVPERLPFDNADAFRLSIEPGQTVTFAAELVGDKMPRIQLWRGLDYEKRNRDRQLFHGILLGTVGLLAIFLTTIFAANHKAIFPSAALFTWCVLAYLCVDFGFWHKLFNVRPEENAQYRAAGEAAMVASLLIFTHTFLRIGRWHGLIRMVVGLMMAASLALVGLAFLDPKLAATFARLSLGGVLASSGLVTAYLALRGQDRALALVPTLVLFGVWTFGAALVLTGRLQSDVIVNGLIAGLVLLVTMIGFTVTQFAFRQIEPLFGASPDDQALRSQAIDGTGATIFEWNVKRDEIRVGPMVAIALGQPAVEMREPLAVFTERLLPADRERLTQMLGGLKDRGTGTIRLEVRLQHADKSYRWFEFDGSAVASPDRRLARCVGLVRETTDAKRAQERLLHDAVHDSLTQLPNRGLFLDRVAVALARAKSEPLVRPSIFYLDLDRFNSINSSVGHVIGDSLLITVARRLARLVQAGDSLGRIGGDQFALVFAHARDEREQRLIAEDIRAAVKGLITIGGHEVVLTGSIGIAEFDGRSDASATDLLSDAEVAMYRARRGGADRIERFVAPMQADKNDRMAIENDLRQAIEKRQLKIVYQPIMYLRTEELAGFEATVRWEHPRLGVLNPAEFVPLSERSDIVAKLGSFVVQMAVAEAQRWQKEYPRPDAPLFVSINVSSRQLFRQDLVDEIRHIVGRNILPKGALRLEISEALVMENPEQATEILTDLAGAGARLSLDEFGAGYSSVSFLSTFPFDTVKIDPALVLAANGSPTGTAVLRSIVALAHELGKTVVAEGVEAADDIGLLRSMGCDQAQGSVYGEAFAPREAVAYVKSVRKAEKKLKRGGLFRLKYRRFGDENPTAAHTGESEAASPAATTQRPETGARRLSRRPAPNAQTSSVQPSAAQSVAVPPIPKVPQPTHPARVPERPQASSIDVTPPARQTLPPPVPPHVTAPASRPSALSGLTAPPIPVQVPARPAYAALAALKSNSVARDAATVQVADRSLARLQAEITRASNLRPTATADPQSPAVARYTGTANSPGQAPIVPPVAPRPNPQPSLPPPAPRTPVAPPNLSTLPPAIAASLAKLAGVKTPDPTAPVAADPARDPVV
jgi:diguanylate cyclase (GGDEF)-like protein